MPAGAKTLSDRTPHHGRRFQVGETPSAMGILQLWTTRGTSEKSLGLTELKNFLAEGGEDQFNAQQSGAVVLVKDRIDFHYFHRNHGLGVGNHFHGEMRFTIGDATADRRADAWGIRGVNEVHV